MHAAEDVGSNARIRLNQELDVRFVRVITTGARVRVDERTFDPTIHVEEADYVPAAPATTTTGKTGGKGKSAKGEAGDETE